jgi:hypothetical protein|tara:strand:+ start:834 stop:2477 length:1644 start_codon:yes stop_codon:yes gene_type:complete
MINNNSRFVPKYTPNSVKELVAAPFKEMAAGMQRIAAAQAQRDQSLMEERQGQLNRLYKVADGKRTGWSMQHNKEFDSQFQQSEARVLNAPTQEMSDRILREEVNRISRIYDSFDYHARVRTGRNSQRDEYSELLEGEKKWGGKGSPVLSLDDLRSKDQNWENSTVNIRTEDINGYQTAVGDYIDPKGRNAREFTASRFEQEGVPYTEQTDSDGVTYLVPTNNPDARVAVSGPEYFHPFLGDRSYYLPDTVPNLVTPLEFADLSAFRNLESSLNRQVNSDAANKITPAQASQSMLTAMTTAYNSKPEFEQSAMALYEQEYGEQYDPKDFEPDAQTGQTLAEVEGRKTPKNLFLEKALEARSGFNVTIPKASSGTNNTLLFANVEKRGATGLPDNINFSAEESARYNVYGDKADTLRGLAGQERIDMTFPEEINLQFNAEKINTVRMFADAGIVLVERVNADDVGQPFPGFDLNDTDDLNDLYGDLFNTGGWETKPEAKYFIVPIFGSDRQYSDPFIALEENIVREYRNAGDLELGDKPLRNLYRTGI